MELNMTNLISDLMLMLPSWLTFRDMKWSRILKRPEQLKRSQNSLRINGHIHSCLNRCPGWHTGTGPLPAQEVLSHRSGFLPYLPSFVNKNCQKEQGWKQIYQFIPYSVLSRGQEVFKYKVVLHVSFVLGEAKTSVKSFLFVSLTDQVWRKQVAAVAVSCGYSHPWENRIKVIQRQERWERNLNFWKDKCWCPLRICNQTDERRMEMDMFWK